jgi:hypothetical protein
VFIGVIDSALEAMLRAELPLPDDVGDVTFDAPTSNWSAQLSRVTVNLFLYDIVPSNQPGRSPVHRTRTDGRLEQRTPLPMVQLSYLVSAWAGSTRDEHQLLGDVISRLAPRSTVPADYMPDEMDTAVHLSLGADARNLAREVWSALGGHLRASCTLQVTTAADSFDWITAAPAVERIAAVARGMAGIPADVRGG